MSTLFERLKEERKRLGLNQTGFAELGGITKETQIKYENGTRKPDSDYLEAIFLAGADVSYVLTGNRAADSLKSNESILLNGFRNLDARAQAGVLALISGINPEQKSPKNVFHGNVGQIIDGDVTQNPTFNFGNDKVK